MRRPSAVLYVIFSLIVWTADSSSSALPATADILYWPLTSPQPSILSRVSYDPASLKSSILSYTPPQNAIGAEQSKVDYHTDDLVRIGLFTSTPANPKQWVGSLASLSALTSNRDQKPTLQLHLGPNNQIYHASLSLSSSNNDNTSSTRDLDIELISNEAGPRPYLNRPVVVSPDGTGTEEVAEKTFFQKYWWVILVVTFLATAGGGERQQ